MRSMPYFLGEAGPVGVDGTGNYMTPGMSLTSLTSTALVYRLVSQAPRKNISIRGIIFVLLGWMFLTAVFAGAIAVLLIHLIKDSPVDTPMPTVEESAAAADEENGVLSPEIMHFVQQLMPLFWAAGPGFLVRSLFSSRRVANQLSLDRKSVV